MTTHSLRFKQIAVRTVRNLLEVRVCPDQYVGQISDLNAPGNRDFPVRQPAHARPNDQPAVLLILESPHVDEFGRTPGPAGGVTGRNIRAYLQMVLSTLAVSGYGLILMNAIRYQCSLGADTSYYRNVVFTEVWNSFGQANFRKRLRLTYREGDLVVNACTMGENLNPNDELRRLVERAILDVVRRPSDLRTYHPSFWQVEDNRNGRWD